MRTIDSALASLPACLPTAWDTQPALRRRPTTMQAWCPEGGGAADPSLSRPDLRSSFSRKSSGNARSLPSGIRLTPCPESRRFPWPWITGTAAAKPLPLVPTIPVIPEIAASLSRQPLPSSPATPRLSHRAEQGHSTPAIPRNPAAIQTDGHRPPEYEGGGKPAPNRHINARPIHGACK